MANSKSDSNFNRPLTDKVISAYKKGLLSPEEMHQVEKRLLEDEMEADAFEGLSLLSENKAAKSVEDIKNRISRITEDNRRPQFIWYSVAAGLVVLFTTTWVILSNQNPLTEKIAQTEVQLEENNKEIEPSYNMISPPQKEIASFETKDLSKSKIIAKNESNPSLGHLNKSSSPLASAEAVELSKSINQEEQASSIMLDTISGISPAMAQARAEEREETIELKSSQAPPLAGITQSKEHKVVGQVLADNGKALQGVDVMIKGTTLSTITNRNGYYSIPSAPGATLTFKYQGHLEEQVVVKDKAVVNVTLEKEATSKNSLAQGSSDKEDEQVLNRDQSRRMMASKTKSEEIDMKLKASKPAAYPSVEKNSALTAPPSPAEGLAEFKKYLRNGIKDFNKIKKDLPKMLVVEFLVNKDASLSNIRIEPSLSKELTEEIIRLIKDGPKWLPAQRGNDVMSEVIALEIDLR